MTTAQEVQTIRQSLDSAIAQFVEGISRQLYAEALSHLDEDPALWGMRIDALQIALAELAAAIPALITAMNGDTHDVLIAASTRREN